MAKKIDWPGKTCQMSTHHNTSIITLGSCHYSEAVPQFVIGWLKCDCFLQGLGSKLIHETNNADWQYRVIRQAYSRNVPDVSLGFCNAFLLHFLSPVTVLCLEVWIQSKNVSPQYGL